MKKIRKLNGNLYEFRVSPPTETADPEPAADLFNKGLEAEARGKTEQALKFYYQTLSLDANTAGALVNIGCIEYRRSNIGLAEDWFRKALEIDPRYSLALFNLAVCLSEKRPGQHLEVIELYGEILSRKPDYGDAHYNIAVEYTAIGETRKAITHHKLYLKYNPADSLYWRNKAKSEIQRLQAKDLRVIAKSAVSEQTAAPTSGSLILG